MTTQSGRNIILLSDGTCNAAFSREKSNVWRLYDALDLSPDTAGEPEQLVFYDNGVGTSGFKPLLALGAVFGWGLSRNVRDLYGDLCRHYRPGDRIYLFGFSRGAYTVRVLADLIATVGIVKCDGRINSWPAAPKWSETAGTPLGSERGFRKAVRLAYKSYRQLYWKKKGFYVPNLVSAVGRFVRDQVLRLQVPDKDSFKREFTHPVQEDEKVIEFMGVWDTVDALGLPVDEMSDVLDKYIYPYKFGNHRLGKRVKAAVQALAIDDARHTFHPLLWDEGAESGEKRIEQVWFTGMHADVGGGGYADDRLAFNSLTWMIDHAAGGKFPITPLKFNQDRVNQYRMWADPLGRIHNSRQGAAVFYRFKPRNIHRLSHEEDWARSVQVKPMIIHHSALCRIQDQRAGYAPVNIPDVFMIQDENLNLIPPAKSSMYHEGKNARQKRAGFLSAAEDITLWGRQVYFAMLTLLISVIAMPLWCPGDAAAGKATVDGPVGVVMAAVTYGLDYAHKYLPDLWYYSYQQHIPTLIGIIALFGVLYTVAGQLNLMSNGFGYLGWRHMKNVGVLPEDQQKGLILRASNILRTYEQSRRLHYEVTQRLIPLICAAGLIGLFAYLIWLEVMATP